ncbi:MAG: PIG-L family deacetylase, partial [Clostridia bacterium]|nr:PIG-L family deacetylase [Clostridia bacterium]
DENGFYKGNVSDTVTLVGSAASLSVNVDSGGTNLPLLRDRDDYTGYGFNAGETVTVRSERPVAGLYIQWDGPVNEWTLSYDGKNATFGRNGFLHEYVEIPGGAKECIINIPATTRICEIYAFSEGELPDWVQRWEKSLEKADLLVFSTHADDEVLFFGGAITLYCALGYRTQVVYMCNYWNGEKTREHEKLDGLWTMGVRNYPVNMDFDDHYAESLEYAKTIYNYEKLTAAVAENIRRFKPQVIVSHDINGEYGHGGHIILCAALREAVEKTADATAWPESANKYATWDVPKTYLHLYGENKLRLDLRQKMDVLGGLTPLEVEKNAYLKHESQQWTWFYVDDEYQYSCAAFGLYRTTVGNDSGINDMMENIVSYAEQERTPEPTPEPTPTPESGETSVPGTATPEENPTETLTEIPAETPDATPEGGKTDPDKGTKNNVGRIILGIVLLLAAAALFFFVLVPLMSKILNRKRK